jgi:hypothetical protein
VRRCAVAIPDPDTLRRLYQDEGRAVREIARLAQCRTKTLLEAMDAAGIERRRRGPRRAPLPDWDREKLQQLAKVQGHAYVYAFARRHRVSRAKLAILLGRSVLPRGRAERQVVIEHDAAIREAYDRGVPVKDLAARYGCTVRGICYSLDRTSGKQSDLNAEASALRSDCFLEKE